MYKRIKELRLEKGLTKAEVAEHLSISVSTLTRLEEGRTKPKLTLMMKVANFYDTSLDYLAGIVDLKEPYPKPDGVNIEQIHKKP